MIYLVMGSVVRADTWEWFTDRTAVSPKSEPLEVDTASVSNQCIYHILNAQKKYGIPDNLLLAIGLQETGRMSDAGLLEVWPWSVNAAGVGKWFKSREQAKAWTQARLDSGVRSIDVGCMQINLRWHPTAFEDLAEGFDPAVNVDYAARLLVRLRKQTGDWTLAAGSYHSFTPHLRNKYIGLLKSKISIANNNIKQYKKLNIERIDTPAPRPSRPTNHSWFLETAPTGFGMKE